MIAIAVRLLLTLITGLSVFYFTYWVGGAFMFDRGWSAWIPYFASLILSLAAVRYMWIRTTGMPAGLVSSVVLGAIVAGSIGFAAGFFGPMILTPRANQGPMLGLFITGPLGFALGVIGGAIYWFVRGRQASS